MPHPVRFPHQRQSNAPDLSAAALLVIDLQVAFTDKGQRTFVRGSRSALRASERLVRTFRSAARPIAFTRHAHLRPPTGGGMASWWGSFLLEGSPGALLDPALLPRRGELVVRKEHYSAFRQTHMNEWLRARSVRSVVLCGTMTHLCVDTTARDAFMHGFDVVIVEDACASKHKALHEASLQCLSNAAARIVTTNALLEQLAGVGDP